MNLSKNNDHQITEQNQKKKKEENRNIKMLTMNITKNKKKKKHSQNKKKIKFCRIFLSKCVEYAKIYITNIIKHKS